MLKSSELMLLITLCDTVSTSIERLPENLNATLNSLVNRDLVKITKGIIYPTKRGVTLIQSAKLENKFRRILPLMNFRMISNLWHRLLEYCKVSGFHLNVVFKNLEEEDLQYLLKEIEEAIGKRELKHDIINFNDESEENRNSVLVCEQLDF